MLRKGVSYMKSLDPPTQPHKNGPWAWNTSLPKDRVLTACVGLVSLCGNIFSCFRLKMYVFVLLKCVYYMACDQPHYFICPLQGGEGALCCTAKEGCRKAYGPALAVGRDLLAMADLRPLVKLILLCLFSM